MALGRFAIISRCLEVFQNCLGGGSVFSQSRGLRIDSPPVLSGTKPRDCDGLGGESNILLPRYGSFGLVFGNSIGIALSDSTQLLKSGMTSATDLSPWSSENVRSKSGNDGILSTNSLLLSSLSSLSDMTMMIVSEKFAFNSQMAAAGCYYSEHYP